MADTVTDQKEMLEVTSHADDSAETVTVLKAGDLQGAVEESNSEEYILQQALEEASDALTAADAGQSIQIRYTTEDGVELQEGDIVNTPDGPVQFISSTSLVETADNQAVENYNNNGYQIITNAADNLYVAEPAADTIQLENENSVDNNLVAEASDGGNSVAYVNDTVNQDTSMQLQPQIIQHVSNGTAEVTLPSGNSTPGGAPLGSSQNPIRIIQQGNQYIPVQQLTGEQLQQIMQVVQQQQLTKQSSDFGSSVLFNPQTNTRIVYRVIYPSELHKDGEDSKLTEQEKVHGNHMVPVAQKRQYKKRNKEDEEEKIDTPELTKEEKEARKKLRPKTRSGRVSKPPKHMVKDFKHIHVLDYDEDYDDSDGGYSDFKQSDQEEEDDESSRSSWQKDQDGIYLLPDTSSLKPKKWKCITCEKAYIGRAGLGRHLKLYPSHGTLDPESEEMEAGSSEIMPGNGEGGMPTTYTENGGSTSITPTTVTGAVNNAMNGVNSAASLSEDSRDSSSSISYTPRPRGRGLRGRPPWKGRGRGRGRPRGSYSMDPELRRKNKLREIVRDSTDEELMEIVLPRLTKVITLWEFLLMKVEKGNPTRPHADDIYKEYMKLHEHVKRLCLEYLECIPSVDDLKTDSNVLRVEESAVAEALGLTAGPYRVKEISEDDSTYEYKLITSNRSVYQDYTNKSFMKRTVEVVSPQELISPSKKAKIIEEAKQKIMPVSFSNKLTPSTQVSVSAVQTVPGPVHSSSKGRVIVVSQPVGLANKITNSTEIVGPKPGSVHISANHLNAQSSKVACQETPKNVIVHKPNVNNIDTVRTSLQSQNPVPVNQKTGTTVLKPSVGTISLLNQSVPSSMSLLKPSVVTPAATPQKFIIVSGTNVGSDSVSKTGNFGKPKEIVLDTSPHLPSSFVNTPSQAQNSFISSHTSSDITVPAAISNTSTLLPNSFVPPLGSTDSVSLLNGRVYAKGNSQQPVGYIAVPVSQPSQPQLSVSSFNQLSGTVVLQPVLDGMSNSDAVSYTDVTTVTSTVVSNVYTTVQPTGVLNSLDTAVNSNLTSIQVVSDPLSASNGSTNLGSIFVDKPILQTTENKSVSNGVTLNSQDDDQTITQLYSETEQTLQSPDPDQQKIVDVGTHGDVDMEQTNPDTEQIGSCSAQSETLGVINSIDASDTQMQTADTEMSVLVNNENGVPVDESEAVHMDSLTDRNEQEETIQIPAANIYQTEDGIIFIQNSDGTTMQLQGSDGQNIPLETIQALLAMDGAQLVTEQSEEAQ